MSLWWWPKLLDSETKRRIDTARDILVGQIPDPKSQIEQITIALIYKFMNDMDKNSEELGGLAKFFTGDYTKYAWNNILDQSVSGFELVTLYDEAIQSMNQNPNLPQLFRDIFKNVNLPYRDPETLRVFLRIIDDFKYDHSERLGDAFEYLLSVMGSQGDAGQFRTPRHIIDFIVKMVDPSKNDTIFDPACGTAGFLISAHKHIVEKNKKDGVLDLTTDEREKMVENIVGYAISPDMVRLSLVNLYLHEFKAPYIYEYDVLTSDEKWDETFDVALANSPFITPKGGIIPHNRFVVDSNRAEVLFVDYIAEHLNPDGKAGIVVPEGIIFQSGKAYKQLRKMLVEDSLCAVVSLPAGVLNPYSGVKTSILLLDKKIAKKSKDILFVKVENDGRSLGAQRKEIKDNDLPLVLEVLQDYKKAVLLGEEPKLEKLERTIAHLVPKEKIGETGDYNLSGVRYKEVAVYAGNWDLVELGEVCDILDNLRKPVTKSDRKKGIYPYYGATGILDYVEDYLFDEKLVLLGEDGAKWNKGDKSSFIIDGKNWVNNHAHVIRPQSNLLLDEFLVSILNYIDLSPYIAGVTVPKLNQKNMREIKIPLPPLEVQERIVEEIEIYQNIIDGAKKVVESYKPIFKVDPNWELVELGNVCELNPKKSEIKELSRDLEVSFIPMADVNEHQMFFKPFHVRKISEVYSGYTYFKENDILLARVTLCFENGKSGIVRNLKNGIGFGSSEYFVLRPNKKILSEWIYFFISKNSFLRLGKPHMTGTGGLQRLTKEFVSRFKIPLPPIETQKKIIAQIEDEQEYVNSNKKLIELFENKINDKITEAWGE